ncbi:MAG: tetratricopeptide repeat protein, partial [Bacteroidota bacterium]
MTFTFFSIFFSLTALIAQDQQKIDSLSQVLSTDLRDEKRVDIYNAIAVEYYKFDFTKTTIFANKAYLLSESIGYSNGIVDTYYLNGSVARASGDFLGAREFFIKALTISNENNYLKGEAYALAGFAKLFEDTNEYSQALEYYLQSLRINEALEDKSRIPGIYNQMGIIYRRQGDY